MTGDGGREGGLGRLGESIGGRRRGVGGGGTEGR